MKARTFKSVFLFYFLAGILILFFSFMNKHKKSTKQKKPALPSRIKQTRKKIKKLLPRWYELKCEIQDDFEFNHPLNFEFLTKDTPSNYNKDKVKNFMRDKLSKDYMQTIYYSYEELIYMYACSLAADKVSIELEKDGNEGLSGFWKFYIRNFYFRNFIPRFWSTLDYLSFMVYQLSAGELIPEIINNEPRRVSYAYFAENFSEKLKIDYNNNVGWLSLNDRKNILSSLEKPFKHINPSGKKLLKKYRDVNIHRYLLGIDEITVSSEIAGSKTRTSEYGKLYSIGDSEKKYDYYGGPEFKFSTLITIAKILIINLTEILNDFASLEVMSSIIKIEKF